MCSLSFARTALAVPSSPTNFSGSVDNSTVSFQWNSVGGATGYKVYYSFSAGNYLGAVDNGNNTSIVAADVPDGTYYLAVAAYDNSGDSGLSNEISITVAFALASPTNFTADITDYVVALNWDLVSGATNYNLHYGFSAGNYIGFVPLGNVDSQVIADVPEGSYFLALVADSGEYQSNYSNSVLIEVPQITLSTAVAIDYTTENTLSPFDILTIFGSGFTPGHSAISVQFLSEDGKINLIVPAIFASSTRIEVAVPPLVDSETGVFVASEVNLQLIQASETQNLQSDLFASIYVLEPPEANSQLPVGGVLFTYALAGIDSLNSAASLSTAAYQSALAEAIDELEDLIVELTAMMSGNQTTINMATTDGQSISLSQSDVQMMDRLLNAYSEQISTSLADVSSIIHDGMYAARVSFASSSPRCQAGTDSTFSGGLADFAQSYCNHRTELKNESSKIRQDMPEYAKVAYGGILAVSSWAVTGALGTLTGAGHLGKLGISLLWSWGTDLAQGTQPTPTKSAENVAKSAADGLLGAPVLAMAQPFVDLARIANDNSSSYTDSGQEP
ncbi:MAG TPA: hypothetical protein DCM64_09555 [Gammaproteobacteria bacterium]|mgnify:CR=1 FL=1|jgi:hypothetical protein|nr:fibronectin type III domain-containing protein [Gammaproteobacteria bacterium]MDP6733066.1 fibronectin type III domain-containing protein [Gammaproteobacteria bacterium]HAJ76688.1 hypothetical protein [Gammaproteobacteria bacterium]|tara:strand:- start:198 stop:1880 length:1683 start_codon:yes stop_codon:yes gene_type:complete